MACWTPTWSFLWHRALQDAGRRHAAEQQRAVLLSVSKVLEELTYSLLAMTSAYLWGR
jgi:hypothetical protein